MVDFYRGPAARITDKRCKTRWADLAIRDLSAAYVVLVGRPSPPPVLVGSSSTAGVLAVAFGFGMDPPLLAAAALLMLAAASMTARACLADLGVEYEIWAVNFGVHVLLLHTPDEVEFGQVRRALVRALEADAERR